MIKAWNKTSSMGRWLRNVGVGLALVAVMPGCMAHARGELVYDTPVTYVEAPPRVETYPQTYYHGRPAYLVDGRWYYQNDRRWVVFREEPHELYDYRVRHVSGPTRYSSYSEPVSRGRAYRDDRVANERAEQRRVAERRAAERRADERRADERRDAERRAAQRQAEERRDAEHRAAQRQADERRDAERRAEVRRVEERRADEQRADQKRRVAERKHDARKRDRKGDDNDRRNRND